MRAEPLNGRDAGCIADDLVDQTAGFFTEVVFDGDEETLVFIKWMPGNEEASANCGDETDRAAASIEWVLGAAFIEVANDQESAISMFGQECQM